MDAIKMLRERRSIRKFKNEIVDKETMLEIIDITKYAPSWSNYQVSRFNLVTDKSIIMEIAESAVKEFVYNKKTLVNANNVAVLSYVKGKSGSIADYGIESTGDDNWEIFDAGIACQQFCLAAYSMGVSTVIMGVIDNTIIRNIIDLPENEEVAAIIVYGYQEGESPTTKRLETEKIVKFIE